MMMMFSTVEIERMVLVSTTIANSARAGLRYAIVHGHTRKAGSGVDGESSSVKHTEVDKVVKNFASAGLLTTSNLNIQVTYALLPPPSPCTNLSPLPPTNSPGCGQVTVKVTYSYDPLVSWFSQLRLNLGSTAQGVIAF